MTNACEAMRQDLPGYVHGKLLFAERTAVEAHLGACFPCAEELRQVQSLESLLAAHLPAIEPSPGFASTFANRLAREIEAENAQQSSLLGWLRAPWMVPASAMALFVVAFLAYSMTPVGEEPVDVASEKLRPAVRAEKAPVVAAAKPAAPESRVAAKSDRQAPAIAKTTPPGEFLEEAEPFVDYAIIRELELLEAIDAGNGTAG